MIYTDDPPSYEESLVQCNTVSPNIANGQFTLTRGPDSLCMGHCSLIADFIPWTEFHSCEDMGYLLLRVNNWLHINPSYDVDKCEMITRMINSKGKLEVSNCYIFNMTCGRRQFINQLRLHIKNDKSKVIPDRVCLQTIIPELLEGRLGQGYSRRLIIRLQRSKPVLPKFQDMTEIISKLNSDIENGTITGHIINISSFYLNIVHYLMNSESTLEDRVSFFEEPNQGKCHLKCLRVFYKPGPKISERIEFKTFVADQKSIKTLDQLTNSALDWMHYQNIRNMISMEISHEYSVKDEFGTNQKIEDLNATFTFTDKCLTLLRTEIINLFYFNETAIEQTRLQRIGDNSEIIWITPRRDGNIYETCDSFMDYLQFVLENYENHIFDIETVLTPNALSWSSIRTQTLERYVNENATNYQFYTTRLMTRAGKMTLPLKGAPLPYASPTKYSVVCVIS